MTRTDVRFFSRADLQSVLLFFTIPASNLVCIPNRLCVFIHFLTEVDRREFDEDQEDGDVDASALQTPFIYALAMAGSRVTTVHALPIA
jgi:hypothetical protein